jgi:hypothetical protein
MDTLFLHDATLLFVPTVFPCDLLTVLAAVKGTLAATANEIRGELFVAGIASLNIEVFASL